MYDRYKLVCVPVIDKLDLRVLLDRSHDPVSQTPIGQHFRGVRCEDWVTHVGIATEYVGNGQVVWEMAGANDLDAIIKHKDANGCGDKKVAVNDRIREQLLKHDARDLQHTLRIDSLVSLLTAEVPQNKRHGLFELGVDSPVDVRAVGVSRGMNVRPRVTHRFDMECGNQWSRIGCKEQSA